MAVQLEITPYLRTEPRYHTPDYFGAGNIRRVRLSDFCVYHRLLYGLPRDNWQDYCRGRYVNGLIDLEQSIEDLTIENFRRDVSKDCWPDMPTLHIETLHQNRLTYQAGAGGALSLSGGGRERPADFAYTMTPNDTLDAWGSIKALHFTTEA